MPSRTAVPVFTWGLVALAAVVAASPRAPACAETPTVSGPITIEHPWARATIGEARTAAAYMTLRLAPSASPDRVVGASSPIAAKTELHSSAMDGGVMRMRPVGDLPIPPGGAVTLAPGGLHVMLTGLAHGINAGETFPLTLRFAHAPPATVDVAVEAIGSPDPAPSASTKTPGSKPENMAPGMMGHDASAQGAAPPKGK